MNMPSLSRRTIAIEAAGSRSGGTFSVVPGRVYELQALAVRADGTPGTLGLAELRVGFFDEAGKPVDPAIAGPDLMVPHLDPARLAAPAASDDLDEIHDAAAVMRFLVAPPDAVEARLTLETPRVELRRAALAPLALNWPAQGKAVAEDVERIARAQAALLARHFPPDRDDVTAAAAREATRTHGPAQFRAIAKQFAPKSDWAGFLGRTSVVSVKQEIDRRLARLKAGQTGRPRIGFIGSARGYYRLKAFADLICLRESEWERQLRTLPLDAILIETAPESLFDEWSLAFCGLDGAMRPQAGALVEAAKLRGLPLRVHVVVEEAEIGVWRTLLEAADAVTIEGGPGDWTAAPERAVFVRRAVEPSVHAPLRDAPLDDALLVPVAVDAMTSADFRDLLAASGGGDVVLTDAHYGFVPKALGSLLPRTYHVALPAADPPSQARLLQGASLALLSGETQRAPAQLEAVALEAVANGAVPVIARPSGREKGFAARLDCVWSVSDLQELRRLYRVPWLRERRWRELYRALFRDHVWNAAERRAVLGGDPCAVDFDTPRVTAIVVSKRPHYVARCLRNFRAQSWPNKELIVVLNRDTPLDPPPELHNNERLVMIPSSQTIGYCLNLAVERATGAYWCKIDDDDYYSDEYLAETVNYFRALQAEVVGRQSVYFYLSGQDMTRARLQIRDQTMKILKSGEFIAGPTLSARKDKKIPPFPLNFRQATDSEWTKTVLEKGLRVASTDSTSMVQFRDADAEAHTWIGDARAFNAFSKITTGNIADRLS